MKKLIVLLLIIFSLGLYTSCEVVKDKDLENISLIMPSGTPSLALANYAQALKEKGGTVDIVAGADLLVAAFNQESYDVIVAPVNLGAKMYNASGKYLLYKTIVWGNLYLASKQELNSLDDINNKEVVVFGKNSTPDIVFQTILKNHPELKVNISYVSDVSEANTLLAANQADYVISAEPAISKLKAKLNLNIIDLQDEWKNITKDSSYPQAGIFVRKSLAEEEYVKSALNKMKVSVLSALSDPEKTAINAVNLHQSFKTLGAETLISAIPNCHFAVKNDEQEAVYYYLQMMIDLGFGAQTGGKLPDEDFFY